jgi:hypothetical protein
MDKEMVPSRNGNFLLTASAEVDIEAVRNVVPQIRELIETTYSNIQVLRAHVRIVREQCQLEVETATHQTRIHREDVLPALALARAHQAGRTAIRGSDLDADLQEAALSELEVKRQRRLGRRGA